LKDGAFVPQYVTALPGQTVLWTNEDDEPHKIQAVDSADFASTKLAKRPTCKYTFSEDAERGVEYRCSIHPETMSGLTDIATP
jgi:plastocyanin